MEEEQSRDQIENPTSTPVHRRRMWLPPPWLIGLVIAIIVILLIVAW